MPPLPDRIPDFVSAPPARPHRPTKLPTSTKFPTTATGNTGSGTDWTNPTNAGADDGSYAVATEITGLIGTTKDLIVTGFGFEIPASATVVGITVEVERRASNPNALSDLTVKLMSAGASVGNNKAAAGFWGTSDATVTYGGAADVWGWSPTPTLINAATFGLTFSVTNADVVTDASVDFVRITVTYTSGIGPVTVSRTRRTRN